MLRLNARDNVYRYSRSIHAVEQSDGSYLHEDGDIVWYNKSGTMYHREDGPAVIRGNIVYWYYLGIEYNFDLWCMLTNKSDEVKMMLRLQYV